MKIKEEGSSNLGDPETANDEGYPVGAEVGALLLEPEAPEPGTFTLLLPLNFTWGAKRRNQTIRIDFREIAKTRVQREDAEGTPEED